MSFLSSALRSVLHLVSTILNCYFGTDVVFFTDLTEIDRISLDSLKQCLCTCSLIYSFRLNFSLFLFNKFISKIKCINRMFLFCVKQ